MIIRHNHCGVSNIVTTLNPGMMISNHSQKGTTNLSESHGVESELIINSIMGSNQ